MTKKQKWLAIAGGVLAAPIVIGVLAGDSLEPETTAAAGTTTTVVETTTTEAPTTTTTTQAPTTTETDVEDEFITLLAASSDAYFLAPDDELIELAWELCDLMRVGRDDGIPIDAFWMVIQDSHIESDLTGEEAVWYIEMMAAATHTMCPDVREYMDGDE